MEGKTREEILAERKLRKAAKQSRKKGSNKAQPMENVEVDCTAINFDKLNVSADVLRSEVRHPVSPNSAAFMLSKNESEKVTKAGILEQPNLTLTNEKLINKKRSELNADSEKSKSQLRAERRAKQEAQRAVKAEKRIEEKVVETREVSAAKIDSKAKVKTTDKTSKLGDFHKIKLFSHLYRNASLEERKILADTSSDIHRAIIKLGVQYRNKVIIGSNARVIALLNALKQVISDHQTPAEKDFSRGFEVVLVETMLYLNNCRPSSVSMTNAVKFLKSHLSQLPNNISDHEAQIRLREAIDDYMKEQIDTAGKAICIMVQRKISQDDVILTFGYSSLIERILVESHQVGLKFRVIIVDAGPLYEGRELLRRLVKNNLDCVYVLLSAASYIMKEANKVLLGAHALLANGYVMSRAGSSQVALIAKSFNVPVLVCCETHKFSERVQTDAFVHNELGDADKLMKDDVWKNNQFLTPLTLMYEVTPSDLVTAVVTELAILPCTSVPVVLRVKPASSTS